MEVTGAETTSDYSWLSPSSMEQSLRMSLMTNWKNSWYGLCHSMKSFVLSSFSLSTMLVELIQHCFAIASSKETGEGDWCRGLQSSTE